MVGDKCYELSNHLGNVLVVVNDKKKPFFIPVKNGSIFNGFNADIVSYNDYYPFGMTLPYPDKPSADYRYGFQGQEKDDELKGPGNSLNYTFRMHDPRVDPLAHKAPVYSPYAYCFNNPVYLIDLDGRFSEPWLIKMIERQLGNTKSIKFSNDIYSQMNKSWSQSFDNLNNSTERGATLTVNTSKKPFFEFVNIGGKGSTSGTFDPDMNIDKKKNVPIKTFFFLSIWKK